MIFWDIVSYLKYVLKTFEIWLDILRYANRYLAKSAIFKDISRYPRYLVIFQICWYISKVDLSENDWDILHICRYLRYFGISWLIFRYLRCTTSQMVPGHESRPSRRRTASAGPIWEVVHLRYLKISQDIPKYLRYLLICKISQSFSDKSTFEIYHCIWNITRYL